MSVREIACQISENELLADSLLDDVMPSVRWVFLQPDDYEQTFIHT